MFRKACAIATYSCAIVRTFPTIAGDFPTIVGDIYKVAAYNSSYGEGAQSWDAYAATKVAAPSNVTATTAGTDSITVSWTSVNGASRYYVYRPTTSGGTYSSVGNTTSTSYADSGLSAGATYYYKVAGSNDSGYGTQSSVASATTTSE